MCISCAGWNRRRFLSMVGGVAAGIALGAPHARAKSAAPSVSPDEALERLKQGNARFVANAQLCEADLAARRQSVAAAQAPWASVLSCADSRVPPELLFGGLGVGELFVARNAGNLVDTDVLGTMEYGAEHLGSPLIVVMGHQRCGAVAAACEVATTNAKLPGSIGAMIAPIVPVAKAARKQPGDFVSNTVHDNVRNSAALLAKRSKILTHLVAEKKIRIVTAYYELDTGKVEFFA